MSATLVAGREEAKDESTESDHFLQLDTGRSGYGRTSSALNPGARVGRVNESRGT